MHQLRHCQLLLGSGTAGICIKHIIPIYRRTCRYSVYRQFSVIGVSRISFVRRHVSLCLGDGFCTLVIQDLCHSRGDATCYTASKRKILWTFVVVGSRLVPLGRNHRCYGLVDGSIPWSLGQTFRMLAQIFQFSLVTLQPEFHVIRQVVIVELALVRVSYHGS